MGCYQQPDEDDEEDDPDEAAYNAVSDEMDALIEAALVADGQPELHVIYSAYPTLDNDVPINNLHEVAAKGRVQLVHLKNPYWGGPESKSYRSEVLKNPTWLEVCVHANRMIEATGDYHHVFLEGLEYVATENKVKIYHFSMGS